MRYIWEQNVPITEDKSQNHVKQYELAKLLVERILFYLVGEKGSSVQRVAGNVRRISGNYFEVVLSDRRPGNIAELVGCSHRAKSILGNKPRFEAIDTIVSRV